jgi:trehalose/maltose transport system substrate-binding protein
MSKKHFRVLMLLTLVALLSISAVAVHAQDELVGLVLDCPEGEAAITFAGGAVGAELEFEQASAARFTELCPNITVDVLEMPNSTTERLALYQQFWEAEDPEVDVIQVDVIWPGIIAEHVVDMYEYLPQDLIDMYFEGMIAGQTIDERLVAIPFFTDAPGLYYRTDLLEKYDLEVPGTWEELTEAARTIQEGERAETGNQDFWGYVWQGNSYEGLTCDAHEWLGSTVGSTFITPDGEVTVNNEDFVAMLELAASWVGDISPEGVTAYQEEESRAVWQAGNAAFMRNWPYAYNLGNGEDSAIAGLFDYAPLPVGAAGESFGCLGGWQVAVSAYSDNIDAAVAFAQYMASPQNLKIMALELGNNPTVPAVFEDEEVAQNELFVRMPPLLAAAQARPSGITADAYGEASRIFYEGIHSVLTGEATAADAVDDLELDLEDFLVSIGAVE